MSLCFERELKSKTCATGCGYDIDRVWTKDQYYAWSQYGPGMALSLDSAAQQILTDPWGNMIIATETKIYELQCRCAMDADDADKGDVHVRNHHK